VFECMVGAFQAELGSNACSAIERNGFVVVPFGKGTNIIEPYTTLREVGIPRS